VFRLPQTQNINGGDFMALRIATREVEPIWIAPRIDNVDGQEKKPTKFLVRPPSGKKAANIRKKHTKTEVLRGGATREVSDDTAIARELFQYLIVDWENVEGMDGKPLPCTPDNIEDFVDYNIELANKVLEMAQKIQEQKQEAKTKN